MEKNQCLLRTFGLLNWCANKCVRFISFDRLSINLSLSIPNHYLLYTILYLTIPDRPLHSSIICSSKKYTCIPFFRLLATPLCAMMPFAHMRLYAPNVLSTTQKSNSTRVSRVLVNIAHIYSSRYIDRTARWMRRNVCSGLNKLRTLKRAQLRP